MRLSPCSLNLAIDNSLLPSVPLIGGDTGIPDWNSLKTRESLDPLYASVMCSISRDSKPGTDPVQGVPDQCPRQALSTVVEKAAKQFNVRFLVGFEVEFEVFTRNNEGKLVQYSLNLGGGACSGLRDPSYRYVEEAMQVLLEAGVGIEAIHTEGLRGQYEFCLGPKPPIEAVDELILVHDTLKSVFSRHGLVATMFPRPAAARRQSIGQHTHISIDNLELEESLLAGILNRLPALSALCLPYELSYERLTPGQAGSRIVAWGTQDRRVPVRKIRPGHWEIRCVDATANMYATLAATLSAGLLGCHNSEPLLLEDNALRTEDVKSDGVAFPHNLAEALVKLEQGYVELDGFMGSHVLEHYLALKRHEAMRLEEMGTEDSRAWLVELL
jgi:glutamine synthetase